METLVRYGQTVNNMFEAFPGATFLHTLIAPSGCHLGSMGQPDIRMQVFTMDRMM
jgi:hypothetical protein